MDRILDRGLDELAARAHAAVGGRLTVSLGAAAAFALMLPWRICALWAVLLTAAEAWSWFTTRRQFLGRPITSRARLIHAVSLATVTALWSTAGALLWTSGSTEGAVSAVIVWLSVISFAQTSAYLSPIGLALSGIMPAVTAFVVILATPHPHFRLAPIALMLVLSYCFAGEGVARMLSARKRTTEAQRRLSESEALYKLLADNVSDVIALTSLGGERLYITPSIEAELGHAPEHLYKTPNYTYVHPDDSARVKREVADMVRRRGSLTAEYRVVRKDGSVIWAQTNFTLVGGGEDGAEPRVLSVSRNVQARKEMDAELIEAREAAEAAAAAKSDFLANMTHELRTPLNAIIGFSSLLQASHDLGERDRRHANLVCDASKGLLDLVNSVLDFSRLEADAVELDPAPFDPAAEAASMAAIMDGQARSKGLELIVRCEGDGGPLHGDAKRIRQILLNFLSNAIKFTAAGAVTVEVRQTPEAGGEAVRLRLSVSDTGVGLEQHQIAHVFERFAQADVSISRQFGGAGLGLAISKRIAELMGGRVGADSRPGEGSTFWFEAVLPLADQAPVELEAVEEAELDRPIRLLLVEDVAINRELVRTMLADFDVEIDCAEDGVQAIEAFGRRDYDLVLMDMQMPVMDGLTATRRIRALPLASAQTTPIVAMTANVLPEQVAKCFDAGMDDHLGKPISPATLLDKLAYWSSHPRPAAGAAPRQAGRS